jgi:hypothetical protein
MGGRKSYNPKNKGKKSYQPILTFLAETREYVSGELRNGDRPTGAQIARHLESVFEALPGAVKAIYARADSGFYCWDAVATYAHRQVQFIVSARPTGKGLRVPMPMANASSGISRKAGRRPTDLSPFATGRSPKGAPPANQSSTSCLTRQSTAIVCLSPT